MMLILIDKYFDPLWSGGVSCYFELQLIFVLRLLLVLLFCVQELIKNSQKGKISDKKVIPKKDLDPLWLKKYDK